MTPYLLPLSFAAAFVAFGGSAQADLQPAGVEAAFQNESYRPGKTATLRIERPAGVLRLQLFRSGPERGAPRDDDTMLGVPVTVARGVRVRPRTKIAVDVGDWPSGLYFARLETRGRIGFAPFVVAPRRLGINRVAIVMPTRTWQAYNFRDDDGDGESDTWYAMNGSQQARLARPFLNRGVPPHFRAYDLRFLRWLHSTGRDVDVLAQEDLDTVSGAALARAYRLLIFPGHHEYVTEAEYDAVTRFRDLGGNLAFLSANNFFWKIRVRDRTMTRVAKWRDLGRPEASLLGVQYRANDRGGRRAPWLVRDTPASRWLFANVELRHGREFSAGNVEIDAVAPSSPPTVEVVAEIPDLMGPGLTAQMTYYETAAGAKVFAAGAFSLARNVYEAPVRQLLANLWRRLSASGS
jgi:hypothetical protein